MNFFQVYLVAMSALSKLLPRQPTLTGIKLYCLSIARKRDGRHRAPLLVPFEADQRAHRQTELPEPALFP